MKDYTAINNIYLVGPMGSGKSSVARQLAKCCQLDWYDTDNEIEKTTGVDISWIFEREGEAGFRIRECKVIAQLTRLTGIVLSTGGGAIINSNNRHQLKQNGIVIYLQVSLDEQIARTNHNKSSRPLLMANDSRAKLIHLNQQRHPLYQEIADLTYNTDQVSPFHLANKIAHDVKQLKQVA